MQVGDAQEMLLTSLFFPQDFVCHMLISYFQSWAFSIFREINIENSFPNKDLDYLEKKKKTYST